MLCLNTKSRYGLAALLTLAAAHDQGLLQSKEIAQRNNIPPKYLEQIFALLTGAEIVQSVRGKNGGYRLARPPAAITVLEVIEILEGGLALAGDDNGAPDAVAELLRKAEAGLREAFSLSLAELVQRQQQLAGGIMFHI